MGPATSCCRSSDLALQSRLMLPLGNQSHWMPIALTFQAWALCGSSSHSELLTMIKRISLVWKRPTLSDAEFRKIWLGEHVEFAKQLPGVREYTIDFAIDPPK